MAGTPLGRAGLYSPLPQGLSESDSDGEGGGGNAVAVGGSGGGGGITKSRQQREESHTQHYISPTSHTLSHSYPNLHTSASMEAVSILQADKHHRHMSPLRKFFFILSILVCFLTVIVFLWVLPCTELGECSVTGKVQKKKSSWENPYHDIELKGAISVVDNPLGRDKNLILLFRGDVVNPEHSDGARSSADNGIILIMGDSGKVGWFIRQPRLPTDLDCTLIDVDRDGKKDCIVVGDEGLFMAFSPLTGAVRWYLHNHEDGDRLFTAVDFPLVLMDVDGDGVDDMLAACSPVGSRNRNALVLISGYKGDVIGSPYVVSECMSINKLQMEKDRIVSFTCKNNTSLSESLQVVTLVNLIKRITNKPYPAKWNNWQVSKQHKVYGQRKETENQRNVYSVNGRKLIVENRGHCPKNCKVTVQLIEDVKGKENVSWEYSATGVYGMVPSTLMFNNNKKNKISGFVLKFWQWNVGAKNTNRYDRNVELNTYSIFDKVIPHMKDPLVKENAFREKRESLDSKNPNVTLNHLTERVVLVTFNKTEPHIVNASQSDIIQMCLSDKPDAVCQPDMSYQENSLMIMDLDGDGSQELITYLTSFVCTENASLEEYYSDTVKCGAEWKLRSTIRIVRLEAELPKLYETVSHH